MGCIMCSLRAISLFNLFLKDRGKRLPKAEKSWLIEVFSFSSSSAFFFLLSAVATTRQTGESLTSSRPLQGAGTIEFCGLCRQCLSHSLPALTALTALTAIKGSTELNWSSTEAGQTRPALLVSGAVLRSTSRAYGLTNLKYESDSPTILYGPRANAPHQHKK